MRGFHPARGDLAKILDLALPVVGVQLGIVAMGLVDTMMVGRVSPADLAAVALGNLFFFATAIFGLGVLLALDPVVAQAVGAGTARPRPGASSGDSSWRSSSRFSPPWRSRRPGPSSARRVSRPR